MTATTPTTPIQSASLYFREGNSDKEYRAAIEPRADGFVVTFAYGRRGGTLNTGTKTQAPVSLDEATKVFNRLVAAKVAKGYRASNETGPATAPYQRHGDEGTDTGIRCQLLNPVEESELALLLADRRHCLQQKHDGRRLLVRKTGGSITGINRRGLAVAIPDAIREAVATISRDLLIDGEAVGDTLHAFDLLELGGHDLRARRYIDRFAGLLNLTPSDLAALRCVDTVLLPGDKQRVFADCKRCGHEGVVLKNMDAPFTPGRPNSGGPQLKFKFVETASFVVTGHNARRSVTLGLYDGDKLLPAGNVTIPPNHAIPQLETVAECRYLYAFKESGAIYQPVYLGPRSDIPAAECGVDQLKYKAEAEAEAEATVAA